MKLLYFILLLFPVFLFFLFAPQAGIGATKQALCVWYQNLLPTLLVYSILLQIASKTNLFLKLQKISSKALAPVVFVLGVLFGFPFGAKLLYDLKKCDVFTEEEAKKLCPFVNHMGLVYVVNFVYETYIKTSLPLWKYLFLIYGWSAIGVVIFVIFSSEKQRNRKKTAPRFQFNTQIIDAGILSGFETLIKLCGYIVLFSVWVAILTPLKMSWLIAILEVTNGIRTIEEYPVLYSTGILTFGGICGIAQTASVLEGNTSYLLPYIRTKIGLSTLSVLCAILF